MHSKKDWVKFSDPEREHDWVKYTEREISLAVIDQPFTSVDVYKLLEFNAVKVIESTKSSTV